MNAIFSPCGQYRYTLEREWMLGDGRKVLWIMLNPSTADAVQDDATIRRCTSYSQTWGYSGLLVGNLFGLRSTEPAALCSHSDPVGPENDAHLGWLADRADMIICAWGNGGTWFDRGQQVEACLRRQGHILHAIALTKNGQPVHPVRQGKGLQPFELPRDWRRHPPAAAAGPGPIDWRRGV